MEDVIIIGAGIIGSTLFYELSQQDLKVRIFEKRAQAGLDVTGHNSAIIHAGVDPKSGSLKAKYNLEALALYPEFCKTLNTPYQEIPALVLAFDDEESKALDLLEARAVSRKIEYQRLKRDEILELEPKINPLVVDALRLPKTAIVSPSHLASQALSLGRHSSARVHLNERVLEIQQKEGYFWIKTSKDIYQSKVVVNAAGLYASEIEELLGKKSFELRYRRGEYLVLTKEMLSLSKHILYPVPTEKGKGVLYVPTVDQTVLIGPNAVDVESISDDVVTNEGIEWIKKEIEKKILGIEYKYEIDRFSGLRPRVEQDDFIIEEHPKVKNWINCVGIESPGISSAPAIAKDVVQRIILPKFKEMV